MSAVTRLYVVVPCYNEEDVLPQTVPRLERLLEELMAKGKVSQESCVYFVDDGSCDQTWAIIEAYAARSKQVKGIKLSRNRGHQNALFAGLVTAEGDAVVSIDADLQDDIDVIEDMIAEYDSGAEIVYGVRRTRTSDTFGKRVTAEGYYKLLRWMGVDVVFNHADFRLLSRRALDVLKEYGEVNLFLRGIVPTLGMSAKEVLYERHERAAGESKYPISKMLALAADGITSFSAFPLRLIAGLGLSVFVVSVIIAVWALAVGIFSDRAVPGWTSSVLPMYLLGGIQLLSIGVLGEYVAKIYMETKRRPRFIIEKRV